MDVRRESKHEVIEAVRRRYRGAGRAEKGRLIDEASAVTGYHRHSAQALLRKGVPYSGPRLRRGGRPRVYGRAVEQALAVAAKATGGICGKRLAAALPDLVPALGRAGARLRGDRPGGPLWDEHGGRVRLHAHPGGYRHGLDGVRGHRQQGSARGAGGARTATGASALPTARRG